MYISTSQYEISIRINILYWQEAQSGLSRLQIIEARARSSDVREGSV